MNENQKPGKYGMWKHDYESRPTRHLYSTWMVDEQGREYNYRYSEAPCLCRWNSDTKTWETLEMAAMRSREKR